MRKMQVSVLQGERAWWAYGCGRREEFSAGRWEVVRIWIGEGREAVRGVSSGPRMVASRSSPRSYSVHISSVHRKRKRKTKN